MGEWSLESVPAGGRQSGNFVNRTVNINVFAIIWISINLAILLWLKAVIVYYIILWYLVDDWIFHLWKSDY